MCRKISAPAALYQGPSLLLADLAVLPIWAAWREEWKNGKWTKPPKNAKTGGNAQNNNPRTWHSRKTAERRAEKFGADRGRGVGLMLSGLGAYPGWRLCGLDLDGCRDSESGALSDWAEPVLNRFDSYAEPSPSATGVHVYFFARDEDIRALHEAGLIRPQSNGKPGAGRAFALQGEHCEISLFAERKFLTVTDAPLKGFEQIKPVSREVLEWLLVEHGPSVQATGLGSASGSGGRDETGSGAAFRFLQEQAHLGRSEDEAIEAIEADTGTAGEWWGRTDDRQRKRAIERGFGSAVARIEALDALLHEAEVQAPERMTLAELDRLLDADDDDEAEPAAGLSEVRKAADARAAFGDVWNGACHADRLRGQRLFVSATAQWLEWTGRRWAAMTPEQIAADAKETSAELFAAMAESLQKDSSGENHALMTKAVKLHGNADALARMERMARSEPGMHVASPAEFDADPFSLTCPNGIVDLRAGILRPARPEDLVSKSAGCAFDPDAECPMFESFLETIMPDPEIRSFVQRAVGYTLTGLVDEEKFFLAYGTGQNGKSVLANIIAAMLGEYVVTLGAALITLRKHENEAERMMAQLPGSRLALVNETAQGEVFDAGRVKAIASREKLAARFLKQEVFNFMPTHKLWVRTNHLPGSLDSGDGFWRRCTPIPFTVQIPDEKKIPDLDRKIIAAELSGVLAWAVQGAVDWANGGLRVPQAIRAIVAEYRAETDLLGEWLTERTERDPDAMVTVGNAFSDYADYCKESGMSAGSKMSFGRAMTDRGFKRALDTKIRRFVGFRLRTIDAPAENTELDDPEAEDLI